VSLQARLLRSTFVVLAAFFACYAAWHVGSGSWPPFGTGTAAALFVYFYDRIVVRPSFDRPASRR
jgi:hypothetical protein